MFKAFSCCCVFLVTIIVIGKIIISYTTFNIICVIIIISKVLVGIVPMKASGINIQLSTVSHAKDDNMALQPNPLLSFGCFNFIF
jgi:hypothetical protein